MTSPQGLGQVERYLYCDERGRTLEFRDHGTGEALLPRLQFEETFLPRASRDAVYDGGFASAGAWLGHVAVRTLPVEEPPQVNFDRVRVLDLCTDLIVGPQAAVVHDGKPGTKGAKERPWTKEEYEAAIARGVNFFDASSPELAWLIEQPVFFRMKPTFPDTFFRSNWLPGRMFIDEPSVRLGWSGGIPVNPSGPEQVAEAMRQRVQSHYALPKCLIDLSRESAGLGTFEPVYPRAISWDTDYWSAWYQLAAGAPAIVHEGRYVKRGYGWEPEKLYGKEGLDDLTFRDQVNCLNGILRGAARAFGGDWGVSVYPEGDPDLRLPALIQAYDMGARHIWFWTYPPMTYALEMELAAGLQQHIQSHPRASAEAATRSARVGIVLPPGYVFSWDGTWGMQREQHSRGGASYGDISAAAMWEAILCSRRRVAFDFLVDEPRIRGLGYKRLICIREDGTSEAVPSRDDHRTAGKISLQLKADPVVNVAGRDDGREPDYTAYRAKRIAIDGQLDEWQPAQWLSLDAATNGFPDKTRVETTVTNDLSDPAWRLNYTYFMGAEFIQVDEKYEHQYQLEDLGGKGVVVTKVAPGSPAAQAGILEGDVITGVLDWPIDWQFQVYYRLQDYKNKHDGVAIPVKLRRSGRYQFDKPGDLAARIAMMLDDENLYVAVDVTDDVHWQPHHGADFWKGDSIQIGLTPTLEQREGNYGEEDHEFALVLKDGRPIVWRYKGRRGQAVGELTTARISAVREGNHTRYEAAIPLAELHPFAPDLWPRAGFDVVVNDSDGGLARKGRIELHPKAMTLGKWTKQFARLACEPSPQRNKVSAAILWQRRATPEKGHFRVVIAASSPAASQAQVTAHLVSLDEPTSRATEASIPLPLTSLPAEHNLIIQTDSPPGRYDLAIRVEDAAGVAAARDHLPVYVYPAGVP